MKTGCYEILEQINPCSSSLVELMGNLAGQSPTLYVIVKE